VLPKLLLYILLRWRSKGDPVSRKATWQGISKVAFLFLATAKIRTAKTQWGANATVDFGLERQMIKGRELRGRATILIGPLHEREVG